MSLLHDLNAALKPLKVPIETGVFSGVPPAQYIVITPLSDTYGLFADDYPHNETQEARLSLFTKQNYLSLKKAAEKALLSSGFIITDRRYIGHEDDTGYHHYVIDVARCYAVPEKEE